MSYTSISTDVYKRQRNINIIKKIAERTQIIETGVEELVNARKVANKIENEHDKMCIRDSAYPVCL